MTCGKDELRRGRRERERERTNRTISKIMLAIVY
jgi:hypothetical protein